MDATLKVLIADDHPLMLQGIRRALEASDDIDVVGEARSGEEALALVERRRPDIVLLDLLKPHLDGFAVIERLRQDARYHQLPIIVLTAKTLTAAEYARLAQSVRTVLQKQGWGRDTLRQELWGILQASRSPLPEG